MARPVRPAATYVHGLDGPTVVVPGRIAAVLMRYGLGDLRTTVRGVDTELDAVLEAIGLAAQAWRSFHGVGSDHGTELAKRAEGDPQSPLTTADVADMLGISDRGVRKAIDDGRLAATRKGDVWLIEREAVEMFKSVRKQRRALD